jgi:hypothetical protein
MYVRIQALNQQDFYVERDDFFSALKKAKSDVSGLLFDLFYQEVLAHKKAKYSHSGVNSSGAEGNPTKICLAVGTFEFNLKLKSHRDKNTSPVKVTDIWGTLRFTVEDAKRAPC